jgi:hypothetical protein
MRRKSEWTVLVNRLYNPCREIIAFGYTKEEALQDAQDSLRWTYGIWDSKSIEVIALTKF